MDSFILEVGMDSDILEDGVIEKWNVFLQECSENPLWYYAIKREYARPEQRPCDHVYSNCLSACCFRIQGERKIERMGVLRNPIHSSSLHTR